MTAMVCPIYVEWALLTAKCRGGRFARRAEQSSAGLGSLVEHSRCAKRNRKRDLLNLSW